MNLFHQSNDTVENLRRAASMLTNLNSKSKEIEFDTIDEALAWHDGDPRATIETLLKDCGFLRQQLVLASGALSHGMTRGWMPKIERSE